MGKAKHLIVISEDAMVYEDLQTLRQLPSFGSIWDKCAFVDRVRSPISVGRYITPCAPAGAVRASASSFAKSQSAARVPG